MTKPLFKGIILSILGLIALSSCHPKPKEVKLQEDDNSTYFSIRQFTQDQWNSFRGSPFLVTKKIKQGNKIDSIYVSADTLEWGDIFKTFFESDISNKKFLGHYNFSSFDDDGTATKNYYYEAKDDNLFTRKLLITTDITTNKVKSIFIETAKNSGSGKKGQKLYYSPLKLIQIQEQEGSDATAKVTEYRFMIGEH